MIARSRSLLHNGIVHAPTGRTAAVIGVILMVVGMVTAPGTATVTAASPAGRSLVITVVGVEKPKVRVRGPGGFNKVVRIDSVRTLRKLTPGTYTHNDDRLAILQQADKGKHAFLRE